MTPDTELVLMIAKGIVYNQKDNAESLIEKGNIDWPRFKDILSYHGLVPFAYISLKRYLSLLPEDLVKILEASYNYYLMFSSYLEREFFNLYDVFERESITFIPIKGVALLEDLYPKYPIRPSTDIDVLVREGDIEAGTLILEEMGFKKELEGLRECYWRKKQYHFVFMKKGQAGRQLMIELHWDIDYRRKGRQILPRMFNRLRAFTIQNREIKLLSAEDTFFTLALHQRRFGKALALRDVCDMARLLNKYALSFDWDYCLTECRNSKISSTIFFALYQVKSLLEVNIPEYVWKGLNVPAWKKRLIRRFIEKNTFLKEQKTQGKNLYLKAHFLLYDSLWEPVDYILNIPPEQFAKFYNLTPYTQKTDFLYKNRLFYIFLRTVTNLRF